MILSEGGFTCIPVALILYAPFIRDFFHGGDLSLGICMLIMPNKVIYCGSDLIIKSLPVTVCVY